MNKIEKDDFRALKREKLKSFISERRSQKSAQTAARKETARRLALERRARLVAERTRARQRTESSREARNKSRVKTHTPESNKIVSSPSRPESGKRNDFAGGKTQAGLKEEEAKTSFLAPVNNRQAEKRQKLLSYLEEHKAKKAEIIAEKSRQKEVIAAENQARRTELKKQKQSRQQPKPIIPGQKKSGGNIPGVIGQSYKRRQLLAYLKKRQAGEKTFAVQRRELKKITEAAIPEATSVTVIPEIIPVVVPVAMPAVIPPDVSGAVPESGLAPMEEKPAASEAEKPTDPRSTLPVGSVRKTPSDADEIVAIPKKAFRIVPFLKEHFVKIIFLLLFLGWFIEIALLNMRLENVQKQIEQVDSLARLRVPSNAISPVRISPTILATTRMEGIRDPFSSELWRIQEITPAQARAAEVRPVKIPAPSGIIKPITPILIIKQPEFMPPEVARAIPESAKLARIPQITVPQVGPVSAPSAPVSSLRFRGILNVAGIDYFFIEGANGGYRVRVGDTVEGFKIYDYRNGVIYFAKDGYTYQLNEEKVSPPLRYRGRMIMAGQEYFFLEGQRTYRAVIGEEIEDYQLVKRVGDYLYFVKDNRLYYLKQE